MRGSRPCRTVPRCEPGALTAWPSIEPSEAGSHKSGYGSLPRVSLSSRTGEALCATSSISLGPTARTEPAKRTAEPLARILPGHLNRPSPSMRHGRFSEGKLVFVRHGCPGRHVERDASQCLLTARSSSKSRCRSTRSTRHRRARSRSGTGTRVRCTCGGRGGRWRRPGGAVRADGGRSRRASRHLPD